MGENVVIVGGIIQFIRQVLAGPVQVFVDAAPPLGTVCYIVNHAVRRDVHRYAFAVILPEFIFRESAFGHELRELDDGIVAMGELICA